MDDNNNTTKTTNKQQQIDVPSLRASIRHYRSDCGFATRQQLENDEDQLKKYELICDELCKRNVKPIEQYTALDLAMIIMSFRRYMDRHFGRQSSSSSSVTTEDNFTIWSATRLFQDFRPDKGAIVTILMALFSFASKFGLDCFSFLDDDSIQNIEFHLATHVDKALKTQQQQQQQQQQQFLPHYKLFFVSTIPENQIEKLRSIAQKHGAVIVSSPDVASHVIYPDPSGTREHETDDQVMIRILQKSKIQNDDNDNDDKFLVHWFYHPDSYNDWVRRSDILGHVYEPKKQNTNNNNNNNKQWHIHARWIRDVHLFNEWMNELDYEMPEDFSDFIGTTVESYNSVSNPLPPIPITTLRLRIRSMFNDKPNTLLTNEDSQSPTSTKVNSIDKRNGSNDDSDDDDDNDDGDDDIEDEDDDQPLAKLRDSTNEQPSKRNRSHREVEEICLGDGVKMPSFSSWFDMETIHEIEKRALSDFFNGFSPSKTPEIYKDIRNYMIQRWRKTPRKSLTATSARKRLSGDSCSIIRVHSFLEHWGLINYNCGGGGGTPNISEQNRILPFLFQSPLALPTNAGAFDDIAVRKGSHLIVDDGGKAVVRNGCVIRNVDGVDEIYHEDIITRDSSVLQEEEEEKIDNIEMEQDYENNGSFVSTRLMTAAAAAAAAAASNNNNNNSHSNSNGVGQQQQQQRQPPTKKRKSHVEYHCDSCQIDCSEMRFHCATKADVDLCTSCYHSGRYSADLQHRDFLQMSSTKSLATTATSAALSKDGPGDTTEDVDPWTENETILLLEALEMYGDNWDLVSEHVGSKGKDECVKQFVRLPIEDRFLKGIVDQWWCQHPGENKNLPTPFDMMRSCGGREAAIAAVTAKGNAAKIFSGHPIVYGDQVNTVVPFVDLLASLSAPEMTEEIVKYMKLEYTSRVRRKFKVMLRDMEKQNQGEKEEEEMDMDEVMKNMSDDEGIKKVVDNTIYKQLIKTVKQPHQVLSSEVGKAVIRACVNLMVDGSVDKETVGQLQVRHSECDVVKNLRGQRQVYEEEEEYYDENDDYDDCYDDDYDKRGGEKKESKTETEDVDNNHDDDNDDNGGDEQKEQEGSRQKGQKRKRCRVGDESSYAVATSILCSACVSASEHAAVEDVEVQRLKEVIVEMKLDMVRRKLAQLEEVLEGEKHLKKVMSCRRERDMCTRAIRII